MNIKSMILGIFFGMSLIACSGDDPAPTLDFDVKNEIERLKHPTGILNKEPKVVMDALKSDTNSISLPHLLKKSNALKTLSNSNSLHGDFLNALKFLEM